MIQLMIPLVSLVSLLVYYFVSYDIRFRKRVKELEKMRQENEEKGAVTYYNNWGLHELI